jgi:ribosome biogenesis GTPase / thiamine phosphate phosphatase
MAGKCTGTILAIQANFYRVQIDGNSEVAAGGILLCTRRSLLKKVGRYLAVGDRVTLAEVDLANQSGTIEDVAPRSSQLDRPPIANVDRILVIFALAEPTLDEYLLSKFLVKAESTGVKVDICLNKVDLVETEAAIYWQERLTGWGYQPFMVSTKNNLGITELTDALADTVSVLAGHSGAGKSSLVRTLIPHLELRIAAVSGKLQRGRHTTRHVELYPLPTGGWIADTPGFNQPDLDFPPNELADCFPEMRRVLATKPCQFNDCTHRQEPNCTMGTNWDRYDRYLEFYTEVSERYTKSQKQRQTDIGYKQKNRAGTTTLEPKLDIQKYRRNSRRKQQQEWQTDAEEE